MTYRAMAAMTRDHDLTLRLAACAAREREPDPDGFIRAHLWELVTAPGWAEAYADAMEDPERLQQPPANTDGLVTPTPTVKLPAGADESVITDDMIREAITTIRQGTLADTEPERG